MPESVRGQMFATLEQTDENVLASDLIENTLDASVKFLEEEKTHMRDKNCRDENTRD